MDLRQLRYFVAIAEEGNVTRAAERLRMQQPPLSQQLRALEAEVGAPLFTRLPRGVALTAVGEALLPEARAVLARSEQGLARARRVARGEVGRLVVGVTTSAVLHPLVPLAMGRFGRAQPDVALVLHEGNASEVTEALEMGGVDVAFLRAPVTRPAGMECRELLREEYVVALPDGHRLRGTVVRLEALRAERFVLVRRPGAPGMYASMLEACRARGFEPTVAAEVGRMVTALGLVAAGLGVLVVPGSMAALRLPGVHYAALAPGTMPRAPLTLIHRAGPPGPVLARFLGAVSAELEPG